MLDEEETPFPASHSEIPRDKWHSVSHDMKHSVSHDIKGRGRHSVSHDIKGERRDIQSLETFSLSWHQGRRQRRVFWLELSKKVPKKVPILSNPFGREAHLMVYQPDIRVAGPWKSAWTYLCGVYWYDKFFAPLRKGGKKKVRFERSNEEARRVDLQTIIIIPLTLSPFACYCYVVRLEGCLVNLCSFILTGSSPNWPLFYNFRSWSWVMYQWTVPLPPCGVLLTTQV